MSNSWAIIIGINQYQGFQPLMQAQNDAVGIRQYLIEDAGFAPDNCILLSDLSKSTEQQAVFPDQVAINDWLETICQGRVQPDDTVWFYFSGYGAQADNNDYLMPVDGDPAQVKQTGIALKDVVNHLKQAPTKDVFMVLDMNRSQSALAGQAIGEQVTTLARKARIPLILSCQPNEFSHETLALRHGLFTAALLEGLRYEGCATLSHLERYLTERIPELCEHHWRPIQNPVVVLPEEQKFQLLWHQREGVAGANVAAAAGLGTAAAALTTDTPSETEVAGAGSVPDTAFLIPASPSADPSAERSDADLIPDYPAADLGDETDLIPEPMPELVLEDELPEEIPPEPFSVDMDDDEDDIYGTSMVDDLPEDQPVKGGWGGCIGLLAAFAVLGLLLAVLFRNQALVQTIAQDRLPPAWLARMGLESDGATDDTSPDEADPSAADDPNAAEPAADEDAAADPTAESPEGDTPESDNPEGDDTDTPDTAVEAAADGAENTSENPADDETETTASGDTSDASDVPASGDTSDASDTSETPPDGVAASSNTTGSTDSSANNGTDTAELLEDARRSLRPSQASRFASAIATARQIPPGDPNYTQAQADIQRWSQVILDLAEGRAAENELDTAINAAKLIPREPADIHRQAQEQISVWQQRADVRSLIREAQAIPRTGQASTYQRGILKLQEVPSDLPIEQADAQRLTNEWTEKMLTIARARAAQGNYFSAIEAAELIPEGTQSYERAQTEIRRWQGE